MCSAASSSGETVMPSQESLQKSLQEFTKEKLLGTVDVCGPVSKMRTSIIRDADVIPGRQAIELTIAIVTHLDPEIADIFAEQALEDDDFAAQVWYKKAIPEAARKIIEAGKSADVVELPELIALIKIVRDNGHNWPYYSVQVKRPFQDIFSDVSAIGSRPELDLLNISNKRIKHFSRLPEIAHCLKYEQYDLVQTWWRNQLCERGQIGIRINYRQIQDIWCELFAPAVMERIKRRASF
jgi:hypothetical protein